MKPREMASIIDLTVLKPEATSTDIDRLCEQAKEYNFYSVCVAPFWAERVKKTLQGTDVKLAVVVGFPLGNTTTSNKCREAEELVSIGVDEIDMVANIGKIKEHDWEFVKREIAAVKDVVGNRVLKVIIECCLLTDEEKISATEAVADAGADFVKTSTGFSKGGATVEDVKLLKEAAKGRLKVKAAGGIRDYDKALSMVEAGADRIGASKGLSIIGVK